MQDLNVLATHQESEVCKFMIITSKVPVTGEQQERSTTKHHQPPPVFYCSASTHVLQGAWHTATGCWAGSGCRGCTPRCGHVLQPAGAAHAPHTRYLRGTLWLHTGPCHVPCPTPPHTRHALASPPSCTVEHILVTFASTLPVCVLIRLWVVRTQLAPNVIYSQTHNRECYSFYYIRIIICGKERLLTANFTFQYKTLHLIKYTNTWLS